MAHACFTMIIFYTCGYPILDDQLETTQGNLHWYTWDLMAATDVGECYIILSIVEGEEMSWYLPFVT